MADERYNVSIVVTEQGIREALDNIPRLGEAIDNLRQSASHNITITADSSQAQSEIQAVRDAADHLMSVFNTLGNAFSFSADLSMSVGHAFTSMADLFQSNFVDVAERTLTYMFTHTMVANFDSVVKRADILNTFQDYMSLAGVSDVEAQAALNRVDLSIRGLPIGLDEAAQRLRRYQMFLGDTQRATDITIGIQKAITAGGASQSMKTMAYMQIDRLLSAGQLNNSRQWLALINGLGVSIRFLSQEMGLGEMSAKDFAAGLLDGSISTDEFLDAVARLATNEDLDKALEIYKSTFESWLSNIQFAAVRGMTNVVGAIDEALEYLTGETIVGHMENFRNSMNTAFSGIAEFIKDDPAKFREITVSLQDLLGVFRGVNVGEFGTMVIENLARTMDVIRSFLQGLGMGRLTAFTAFATTIAGPVGKIITTVGSGLPMLLSIFERFKRFNFEAFIEALTKQINLFVGVMTRLLDLIPDSWISNLMAFALVWGKPLGAVFHGLASGLGLLVNMALKGTNLATFIPHLAMSFQVLGGALSGVLPVIGIAVGALAGLMALIRSEEKRKEEMRLRISERLGLEGLDQEIGELSSKLDIARNSIEEYENSLIKIDETSDHVKNLSDELLRLDSLKVKTPEHLEEMQAIIYELNALMPQWNIGLDSNTESLDANSRAVLENADALLEAYKKENYAELMNERFQARIDAQMNVFSAHRTRARTSGLILDLEAEQQKIRNEYEQKVRNRDREVISYSLGSRTGEAIGFDRWVADFKPEYEENEESIKALRDRFNGDEKTNLDEAYQVLSDEAWNARWIASEYAKLSGKTVDEIINDSDEIGENAQALEEYKERLLSNIEAADSAIRGMFDGLDKFSYAEYKKENRRGAWDLKTVQEEYTKAITDYIDALQLLTELGEGNLDDEGIRAAILRVLDLGDEATIALAEAWKNFKLNPDDENAKQAFQGFVDSLFTFENRADVAATLSGSLKTLLESEDLNLGEVIFSEDQKEKSQESAGEYIDGISEELEEKTETLKQSAETLGNDGLSGFATGVEGAIPAAVAAVDALMSAVQGVLSLRGQTIASLANNIGAMVARALQISGRMPIPAVKRASGGAIAAVDFSPVGTDVVPAILTPGEYVHNTRAVQTFGKAFMEKVNSLNISGAFQELMHRFPTVGGSVVQNDQRSYSDSHDTVNQTIYTSNPDYAYRLSDRSLRRL